MIRDIALDLELVKTLALIQCVRVRGSSAIIARQETPVVVGIWCRLLVAAIITIFTLFCRVAVRIVDKALLLKEVAPACVDPRFVHVQLLLLEGVILDVDLPLVVLHVLLVLDVLLDHADEPQELAALDLLWVEVVGFRYVQVGDDIVRGSRQEHVALQHYVVVELLVVALLKVVHYGQLRWVVLDHQLGGH